MLLLHSSLYTAVALKHRIFCRTSRISIRDRNSGAFQTVDTHNNVGQPVVRLPEAAFDAGATAQVIVDTNGNLVMANQRARELYNIDRQDMGRPFQDIELSYRPAELRSLIEQAYLERQLVVAANLEWSRNGESRSLDVYIQPLQDADKMLGVCITLHDATQARKLEDEVRRARQEAETTSEELQTTNEELQSTNEELQTTNEELQSTNEELETTNEELQSSNEELETMNEEMQSTNEELQTINDELRQRTDELNISNAFLNSILSSLRGGVIVVDAKLMVTLWNPGAEDLWGLKFDEVKGQSLVNLDIGLPVGKLRNPIQTCLIDGAGQQELILDAVNRRGRKITCRVSINPLANQQGQRLGAIIMMEEMGM
jgi:two-component system CheB/CheR fusion protein